MVILLLSLSSIFYLLVKHFHHYYHQIMIPFYYCYYWVIITCIFKYIRLLCLGLRNIAVSFVEKRNISYHVLFIYYSTIIHLHMPIYLSSLLFSATIGQPLLAKKQPCYSQDHIIVQVHYIL